MVGQSFLGAVTGRFITTKPDCRSASSKCAAVMVAMWSRLAPEPFALIEQQRVAEGPSYVVRVSREKLLVGVGHTRR